MSFAACLFPAANGAFFVQKRLTVLLKIESDVLSLGICNFISVPELQICSYHAICSYTSSSAGQQIPCPAAHNITSMPDLLRSEFMCGRGVVQQ